jgi:RNA polymerase sigma-70 factor (ECF subfamily)
VTRETALIAAAKRGSVSAFTDLVGEYREGLLRFLVTRAASYADAEDALQDTLINAYRYIGSYDAKWRFSTWLYRIAINNLSKMRNVDTDSNVEVDDLSEEEGGPLEQCIAAAERENLWLSARKVLNEEVYTALWLRYVEDMSVKDIAAILERSISWTKVNLLRARNELDSELNKAPLAKTRKAYG